MLIHRRLGKNGLRIILTTDKLECVTLRQSTCEVPIKRKMSENTIKGVKELIDDIIKNGFVFAAEDGIMVMQVSLTIMRLINHLEDEALNEST